ncbi:MAG TPA: hypothetical protein VEH04_16880 [Verrucomicrobiae bacterium]|nr:hypothetical protein [Verrucomicrobiae bacterium]
MNHDSKSHTKLPVEAVIMMCETVLDAVKRQREQEDRETFEESRLPRRRKFGWFGPWLPEETWGEFWKREASERSGFSRASVRGWGNRDVANKVLTLCRTAKRMGQEFVWVTAEDMGYLV